MGFSNRIIVFSLDGQRYGLNLAATERVLAAVEVTPLPKAPAIVLGVFNLQGRIIPVVNVRRRFALVERPVAPEDQFLIARAGEHTIAMVVDAIDGVLELPAETVVSAATILPELPYVQGVLRLPDGLVLIHDLSTFLALDEAATLDAALSAPEGRTC